MEPLFFASPAEFRTWLEENHDKAQQLQVGFYKKGSGKPSITWPESVDEALCFGWIDGVRKGIDEESYTIRFTPRKRGSIWSAVNVQKMEELTKLGKMLPEGLRAFAERKEDQTAIYSYEQEKPAELGDAYEAVFRANEKAWAYFQQKPPSYRKTAIHWVASAKKEETRLKRLHELIAESEQGEVHPRWKWKSKSE
ncbi:YdeI/OmpD-associated family protein [Paenibacillus sp. RC67]|uniref:YdeI/OmpD-associated family protein n=1 Tax=Paenibacillus sp. RC67 TaxID=3039392 RepID=UPI0024AE2F8D|nr:YdeI/OmpD-associated family protein [Paenibacillus sp. RC67]